MQPRQLDDFLSTASIEVDVNLDKATWRETGLRFAAYSLRRARVKAGRPRRLMADFIIGAHALQRAAPLLTFNHGDFRIAFPELILFA